MWAAAPVHEPDMLFLVAPFPGLAPIGSDVMSAVLNDGARYGAAVIFSTHQLDLVERLCDSVGILARGRMVATGTVEELRRRETGRLLRVVVPDAAPHWAAVLPGVRVVSEQAGDTILELKADTDDDEALAAALRTGRVTYFAWQQPTLVELFREAVAAPTAQEVAA